MQAAAAAVAMVHDIDVDTIREAVRHFAGVAHRLEIVGEIDGATFVNDSKATNVDATRRALESSEKRVVLIAGGKDKGKIDDALKLVKELVRRV